GTIQSRSQPSIHPSRAPNIVREQVSQKPPARILHNSSTAHSNSFSAYWESFPFRNRRNELGEPWGISCQNGSVGQTSSLRGLVEQKLRISHLDHPGNPRKCLRNIESTLENRVRSAFKYDEQGEDSMRVPVQISTFISNDSTRYPSMPKFMQSLGADTYQRLAEEARLRVVTVQSLIRTIIVPDWLKAAPVARIGTQTETKQLAQPTTFLSQTGILTETTRRPFLPSNVGRR